jgi:hypothetical protein
VFHVGVIQKYVVHVALKYIAPWRNTLNNCNSERLMELITAAHCWQIINTFQRMNSTARCETQCRQAVHKANNSFRSKRYRASGILIHWQNTYKLCSWRCIGHREAQSCEPAKKSKHLPVLFNTKQAEHVTVPSPQKWNRRFLDVLNFLQEKNLTELQIGLSFMRTYTGTNQEAASYWYKPTCCCMHINISIILTFKKP